MSVTRTEMYCHGCDRNFVAEMDMALDGNHEITCPHCSHIHYRVVERGRVTGERWRSSMATHTATTTTNISVSWGSSASNATDAFFLRDVWIQATNG